MQTALTLQDPHSIRAYFTKILELRNSGIEYPVDLDEVWPLAYARKDSAVKILKKTFIEGIDFQPLRQKAKQVHGGQNKEDFKLSVACLEYFIARKVRPVFEVYREVFHKAHETLTKVKEVVKPAVEKLEARVKYLEAKLASNERTHQNEIKNLQFRLTNNQSQLEFYQNHSKELREQWRNAEERCFKESDLMLKMLDEVLDLREKVMSLDALKTTPSASQPHAQVELPGISTGTRINRLVRQYATDHSDKISFEETWNWLYREFRDRFHVDPLRFTLKKNETRIGKINEMGMIEQLLAVAEHLLLPAQMVA